jgi:hypothetical protein
MRQVHIAGEKLFVDYAGDTVPIVDAATGEITQAQIFVAVLGASNYTYACATPRQTTADWIGAQVQALEFIGGVPKLIVPDQTRALIKTPDRYDPEPNRAYEEFARTTAARCWPLARRTRATSPRSRVGAAGAALDPGAAAQPRFFSLAELNQAIAELLVDLNQRPFKKLPGCRAAPSSAGRAGAAAAAARALRHRSLEDAPRSTSTTTSSSRATTTACRTGWSAPSLDVRVTGSAAGVLRIEPARGRPRRERRARRLHHDARAHAGLAPRAPGVDAGQAHRLG